MILPVTLTLAATAALLNIWLAVRTSAVRVRGKVLHGDGGDPRMLRRMRAHANFTEYAPFVLILSGLVELARGASLWLWIAAAVFVLGRVAHAFGMESDKPNAARLGGIMATWGVLLALGVWALLIAYNVGATPSPGSITLGPPRA